MTTAVEGGAAEPPTPFATNTLVLITPPDDPAGIDEVADLDGPDVAFLTCVPEAPCGDLAGRLLDRHGVGASPVSLEPDVKAVLTKVVAGEVDAGFVYSTDALEAGDAVRTVSVPGVALRNRCLAAVATESDDRGLAEEWVRRLVGEPGADVLADAGFGPVPHGS
jgi:molybdate transport system substrate-binding protein